MNGSAQLDSHGRSLSDFSVADLILELRSRGAAALLRDDPIEAERLFRAAVGYAPRDGAVLGLLAELTLLRKDWPSAKAFAELSLQVNKERSMVIRACAVGCGAAFHIGGEQAAAAVFANLRAQLDAALSEAEPTPFELNLAVGCAMNAGDLERGGQYFKRRFGDWVPDQPFVKVSPAIKLQPWCERNGAHFEVLDPPKYITSKGLDPRYGTWDLHSTGVYLAVVPHGEFLSGLDYAFTPDGYLVEDSGLFLPSIGTSWFPRVYDEVTGRILHLWPPKGHVRDEDALFLSCSDGMKIGHWLCDYLPRLRGLRDRPGLKVAIPAELPAKNREFLRYFGISDDRIIECNLGHRYRFRNLVVVQPGSAHRPEPNNICFLTDALRVSSPPPPTRRIFLDRGIDTRVITNQTAFDRMLAAFGFQTMRLSDMSIAQQRDVLSSAEVVIAIYGSDLLCCHMMQHGSNLIELNWDPDQLNAAAAPHCSMIGVKYHLVRCQAAESTRRIVQKKDRDFIVDLAALTDLLGTIGVAPAQERPPQ